MNLQKIYTSLLTADLAAAEEWYTKLLGRGPDHRPMDTDIKIFRMHSLGIPQDRIAKQMGINPASTHNHLLKMATLPNLINADLVRGPCRPSASVPESFLQCRKKAYWALPAGM